MHNTLKPQSSLPLLPALPAIWRYSLVEIVPKSDPSNFFKPVNMTDLAGKFKPMANVDVAKTTLRYPSLKRISTSSLRICSRPAWWMPIPRDISLVNSWIWGRSRSTSSRRYIFCLMNFLIRPLVYPSVKSICGSSSSAYWKVPALLKVKTMEGSKFIFWTARRVFSKFDFFLP